LFPIEELPFHLHNLPTCPIRKLSLWGMMENILKNWHPNTSITIRRFNKISRKSSFLKAYRWVVILKNILLIAQRHQEDSVSMNFMMTNLTLLYSAANKAYQMKQTNNHTPCLKTCNNKNFRSSWKKPLMKINCFWLAIVISLITLTHYKITIYDHTWSVFLIFYFLFISYIIKYCLSKSYSINFISPFYQGFADWIFI
jgi:hypothetical protein